MADASLCQKGSLGSVSAQPFASLYKERLERRVGITLVHDEIERDLETGEARCNSKYFSASAKRKNIFQQGCERDLNYKKIKQNMAKYMSE